MTLALLFVVSFLVSRVIVRIDAHVVLLAVLARRARQSAALLCLSIMAMTLALSTFVPNLITVLAVLPVITETVDGLRLPDRKRRRLLTMLGLGVIYAANIGGIASLVGSPANGLMVAALAHFDVPERSAIGFVSWLAWGVPMAAIFLVASWGVLVATQREACRIDIRHLTIREIHPGLDYKLGIRVCQLTALGCAAAGAAKVWVTAAPVAGQLTAVDLTLVGVTLVYAVGLFLIRLPESGERLLRKRDLVAMLPWRGVAFAAAALVAGVLLERLGAVSALMGWLSAHLPQDTSEAVALVVLVGLTIFLTELFSNTATAVAMWAIAAALAEAGGYSPFWLILGVALASTSAFMSPLATPASGFAFGGLKGLSLSRMLAVGVVVNLLGAAWIALCLRLWVPLVMGL